jgi:uncharacterized protein YggT (Ycf19 family)
LGGLLLVRALVYWQIGPAVNWIPMLQLGAIAIPFRPDFFSRMALFSLLGFVEALAIFYLWLLLLSMVIGRGPQSDPIQRLIRSHLGIVDRWPALIKALLPLPVATLLWLLLALVLTWVDLLPREPSGRLRFEQAFVMGISAYLSWKYLIGALLLLLLLSDYIYFGSHWFWNFIGPAGKNLLLPLRWLPLRLGKIDFAPIVGIGFVFAAAEFGERGLRALYEKLPI